MISAVVVTHPQVTVSVPVPGCVEPPITHVQDATPLASAAAEPSPAALLWVPAGVRYESHRHRSRRSTRTVAVYGAITRQLHASEAPARGWKSRLAERSRV